MMLGTQRWRSILNPGRLARLDQTTELHEGSISCASRCRCNVLLRVTGHERGRSTESAFGGNLTGSDNHASSYGSSQFGRHLFWEKDGGGEDDGQSSSDQD